MATAVDGFPAVEEPGRSGGAHGNERLTAMTGTVLLLLLAAEGVTILRLSQLLTVHFFLGMLLLGPVALKVGSVLYRFFRYYTGSAPYKRKGPPQLLLRLLGPVIVLLTACVFGSGLILAFVGPSARQPWLQLHKLTFILWFGAMALHALAYVPRLPRLLSAEARGVIVLGNAGSDPAGVTGSGAPTGSGGATGFGARGPGSRPVVRALGGRGVRLTLLIASLALGVVIALLTVHLAGAWESPATLAFKHHR